jgi:uncharacterized membrane protein
MSVQLLMIIAAVLLLVLTAGFFFLLLSRIRRAGRGDDAGLEKLSDALMERLASRPLSESQKSRIAEALKELKTRS